MYFLKYVISGSWAFLLLYLSIAQRSGLPSLFFLQFKYADKVLHACFYMIFGILLLYTFKEQTRYPYIISFIGAFAYSSLMEILQKYIFTHRSAEWADIGANMIGIIFGLLICRYLLLNYDRNYKKN